MLTGRTGMRRLAPRLRGLPYGIPARDRCAAAGSAARGGTGWILFTSFPIEAHMSTGRRQAFRPVLDGCRLEDRLVLTVSAAAVVTPLPLKPTVIRAGDFQQTPLLLHSAFQSFLSKEVQAQKAAVNKLAKGADATSLLNSLKANTSVQGGILQSRVEQIANRLPGGVDNLYTPPTVLIPAGSTDVGLKTQISNMLTTLNAPADLPTFLSQNVSLTIVQIYQSSKTALLNFANAEIASGIITLGPNQGPLPSAT